MSYWDAQDLLRRHRQEMRHLMEEELDRERKARREEIASLRADFESIMRVVLKDRP